MFPAWFVSSVIVQRTLRSCRNMQAQTQGPASSPTSWKGTVRHRAEPYAPVGHLDRARGEWPPGSIHVGMPMIKEYHPQNIFKRFHFPPFHSTQVNLRKACLKPSRYYCFMVSLLTHCPRNIQVHTPTFISRIMERVCTGHQMLGYHAQTLREYAHLFCL